MNNTLKKGGLGCLTIFVILFVIGLIVILSDKSTKSISPVKLAADTTKTVERGTSNWKYAESAVDPIDNSTYKIAQCDATEDLNFAAPYDGGSVATLKLQKFHGATDLIVEISKGQFLSHEGVIVKFDNSKPHSYNCTDPVDGRATMIFISSAGALIKRLRSSKEVVIQATFFQEGTRSMVFKVAGLKSKL